MVKMNSIHAFLLASLLMPIIATGQTFKVLHSFADSPTDGRNPKCVLVLDSLGNLYGTTALGGMHAQGSAFMLNRGGKEVAELGFLRNGYYPVAGLLQGSQGDFFGTAEDGGDFEGLCATFGCGSVFKINKIHGETVLHEFTGRPDDGEQPQSLLVEDPAGNIYGTTTNGGLNNAGTIFRVDNSGNYTMTYDFCVDPPACTDGGAPIPGLILDPAGNLYGVGAGGGAFDAGVVFELTQNGEYEVLYNFTGGSDGSFPVSVLTFDDEGNLYGTTEDGGNNPCAVSGNGCGVVFELSPQLNGTWNETTLYTFCSLANCADGALPIAGPLVRDAAGNLYGTTEFGGLNSGGVVFKLDTSGNETVLHSFTGGTDGGVPMAGLAMDSAGNLYGTASGGGANGYGVVFEITP